MSGWRVESAIVTSDARVRSKLMVSACSVQEWSTQEAEESRILMRGSLFPRLQSNKSWYWPATIPSPLDTAKYLISEHSALGGVFGSPVLR
jgi:hypothetical protein